jgi:penicillin-binding protein 1C
MAYYYKDKNPFYKALPKFRKDCFGTVKNGMKFIYPTEKSTVFLPKDFDGKKNKLILKVAHSNREATLYWYVNETYVGTTKEIHELQIAPKIGEYNLTVVDDFGEEIRQKITIKE